jgi:hypothetical protein
MTCAARHAAGVRPALLAQPQQHIYRPKHREGTGAAFNDDGSCAVHVFAHPEKVWNSRGGSAQWIIS